MTSMIENITHPLKEWYQTSAVKAFWQWWSSALMEWVPEDKRQQLFPDKELSYVTPDDDQAEVWLVKDEQVALLPVDEDVVESGWWHHLNHHVGASELHTEVRYLLPESEVLVREIALPAAAAGNEAAVLQYELDRYIPFDPESVVFAHQSKKMDDGSEKLPVDLVVVSKETISRLEDDVAQKGIQLTAIDVNVGGETPQALGVNLLSDALRVKKDWTQIKINLALLAVMVMLVWFVMFNSKQVKESKIARLEVVTDELRIQARRAKALENQLNDSINAANFLEDKKAESVSAVMIINELTQLIPSNSYLTRIILDDEKVEVVGQSDNANALVPILNQSSLWFEPSIVGQVMPDARTGKEKFTIKADLKAPEEAIDEA